MARGLINKYIWLIDTIMRHRRITRNEINRLWILNTSISDGNPLPRRTFYTYCRAIETTFDINIECDLATYEYYIESQNNDQQRRLRDWLLDSVSISGTLSDSRQLASRIMLEDVPSARNHLAIIMEGLKNNKRIEFMYRAFDRSRNAQILLEPYFVRIFKQRWYVIGLEPKKNAIRTYSLDRISAINLTVESFVMPDITVTDFFKNNFGIFTDKSEPQIIKIKAQIEQAKYLRALPLHHSQKEELHDLYSIFTYRMLVTYDLVQELLSLSNKIEVLAPTSLRVKIKEELKSTLDLYQ